MKIGLLTYHAACNFGAQLQTLSTISFFQKKGYDIIVINWYPQDLERFYLRSISPEQQIEHQSFINQFIPTTRRCFTSQDVKNVINELNITHIIVGSDAVFSYIPILKRIHLSRKTIIGYTNVSSDHKIPNPFWGDFKNAKDASPTLIGLSVSAQYLDLGKCSFFEKAKMRKSLEKFKFITVRDRWTQGIIKKLINKESPITPDPVFGFNNNVLIDGTKEDTINKFNLPEKYVCLSFCHNLYDQTWYDSLYELLHKNGFFVINLAMPEGCIKIKCDKKIDVPLSPLDWYNIIRYSSGYIGQRMHPMIVALHNKVPIYIFDHYAYKKGGKNLISSKIYDILERAQLLSYYTNLSSSQQPQPHDVLSAIMTFDRKQEEIFTQKYSSLYNQFMNNIIKIL